MKKFACALALVFSAFALSACVHVAYGPSDNIADAQYVQSAQAVVDSGETIAFMDKGYFVAQAAAPGAAQTWGVHGTIVLTDKTLYFLFWNRNSNAFDALRKLPVADIVKITHIDSIWAPGDCLSIEDKDRRSDLFSCLEMYSTVNLRDKNLLFLQRLEAARNVK